MNKLAVAAVIIIAILGAFAVMNFTGNVTKGNRHAIIETDKGNIDILLFEDRMPITTGNFIKLAQEGYYDGIPFHRVATQPDGTPFVVQGGDPNCRDGTGFCGAGGPGYYIEDEFAPGLNNVERMVAMANAGPGTGGSQFYILMTDAPWLDGKHPVFGQVVGGYDVAQRIVQGDVMNKIRIV